jgi:hypothetical protein
MNWFKRNEKIISYLIGIIGLLFAFYAYFFPIERQGKLSFLLSDSTNVFAVNKPIDELTVLIGKRNIASDSLDLKIFKFRLINNGQKNILPDFYDQKTPFGLQIEDGKIISAKISGFNSEYFKDNILSHYDSTSLFFNKIIIERKEYVDLEILVTHKNYKIPQFVPSGKISSIKSISIINQIGRQKKPFFKRIQKSLLPMGISIAGILLLVALTSIITYLIERNRYNRLLSIYKIQHAEVPDITLGLCKLYGIYGKTTFLSLSDLILNNEEFVKEYKLTNQIKDYIKVMQEWKKDGKVHFEKITFLSDLPNFLKKLKQYNCIKEETNNIEISDELRTQLTLILKYLR